MKEGKQKEQRPKTEQAAGTMQLQSRQQAGLLATVPAVLAALAILHSTIASIVITPAIVIFILLVLLPGRELSLTACGTSFSNALVEAIPVL
eukprot:1302804-Amphidinium_carterae.1